MHLTYDIPTLAIRKNYQCVTKFDNVSEFVVLRYHAFTMTRKSNSFLIQKGLLGNWGKPGRTTKFCPGKVSTFIPTKKGVQSLLNLWLQKMQLNENDLVVLKQQ